MKKTNKNIIATCIIAVFIALLATAYEGNSTEETEKKAEVNEKSEFCTTHQLPIADCFICDPALREPGRLWCKEHDRYEDRCFICHPNLKDENRLWCKEHNLYEDECIFCHPGIKKKQGGEEKKITAADHENNLDTVSNEIQCEEHGVLEKECGICHPELADVLKSGQGLKIRFESQESAKKAGILVNKPLPADGPVLSDLSLLCRVTYNENQFAKLHQLQKVIIQSELVEVGESITKGELLAEIMQVMAPFSGMLTDYNSALGETIFFPYELIL